MTVTSSRGHAARTASAVLLLLTLTACSFVSTLDAPLEENESWYCFSDAECPASWLCQAGICAERQGEVVDVALSMRPSSQTPELARLDISEASVRLGERLPDLVLPALQRIEGTVTFDAAAGTEREPVSNAELTFRRMLDGRTARDSHTLMASRRGRFALDLPAGRYDISVHPPTDDDRRAPPSQFFDVLVDGSAPLSLVVPPADRNQVLSGQLVRQETGSAALLPLDGARVTAISIDRRHLSTSTLTREDGTFVLHAPLDSRSWRLEARPGPQADYSWPRVTFEPIDLSQPETQPWVFIAGRWREPVSVQGRVDVDDAPPEHLWQVLFRLQDGSLDPERSPPGTHPHYVYPESANLVVRGVTQADGTFEVRALPGRYGLHGAPRERGETRALRQNVEISAEGVSLPTLSASPLRNLRGRVETPDGGAGAGIRVRFIPTNLLGATILRYDVQPALLTQETVTASDGTFRAALTDGTYRLQIEPSERTGWARLERTWTVTAESDGTSVDERLNRSGVVWGRVIRADGDPVVGAEVTTYPPSQFLTPLATALTDASGFYRLVLPAPSAE